MNQKLDSEAQAILRLKIFSALEILAEARGGFLTFNELTDFHLEGVKRPLVGQRGIYNPSYLDHTLSIMSSPSGPYEDKVGQDGLLQYAFEAGDPLGGANRKLRQAMDDQVPILLFERPLANVWVPIISVYVVGEDRARGFFQIAVGEEFRAQNVEGLQPLDKRYVERVVRQRVHQPMFRARVVSAYNDQCAICRLRHRELLDAAHIIPDSELESSAEVSNGIALCKIHHAAYDRNLLGVDSSYKVHVPNSIMGEVDGPMLKHGIQEMNGASLLLPSARENLPNQDWLNRRFDQFRMAQRNRL